MDSKESKPLLAEDFLSWRQSVVDYVTGTLTSFLDLETVPSEALNSGNDIQPVFDSLIGSAVTEVHLGGKPFPNMTEHLSKILCKTSIEKLNLEYCSLKVDDVMSIMAVLKETRITELNISRNMTRFEEKQIESFISHVVNSRLQALNLSWNSIVPLQNISALFQRLPDTVITHLDLSGFSHLSGYSCQKEQTECVSALVSSLPYSVVTDLNLGSHGLGDSLAKAIGAVLEKSKLDKLNLSDNRLTDSGVDFLVSGLVNSKITHLNLSKNMINGDNSLGHSLKNTKVRELDLSRNPITNGRIFSGGSFLRGSDVRTLKLYSCLKSNETVVLAINSLRYSELARLDLSCNTLSLEHVSAFADVLRNSKLTHVSLHNNELSNECLDILGNGLVDSQLKYINLWTTARSPNTYRGIASFLDKTKSSALVSLNLRKNDLPGDANTFASAIANTTFLALDLESNFFLFDFDRLAEQLKFTAITKLNLSNNDIRDDGAVALANCLGDTLIVQLNMGANSITSCGAKALAQVLQKTKLRQLDLKSNEIGNDGLESLAEHAASSCMTCLNIENNPGNKKLLVDRALWENRKRIQIFADLLQQTALFAGDSTLFEFDRNFDGIDVDGFIEDCLMLYRVVVEKPFIVNSIEQDKCISVLESLKLLDFDSYSHQNVDYVKEEKNVDVFIKDCEIIYRQIMDHPSPVKVTAQQNKKGFSFSKQSLWLLLEEFPRKFVSFIGRAIEADVEQHVSLLKKVEDLGLTGMVELLLLNRPLYVIEESQNILHPFVYTLLRKYKQPICNKEIEPEGVEKIVEYFTNHIYLDGAPEVISFLSKGKST